MHAGLALAVASEHMVGPMDVSRAWRSARSSSWRRDISRGLEPLPIAVVNAVGGPALLPPHFEYATHCRGADEPMCRRLSEAEAAPCSCDAVSCCTCAGCGCLATAGDRAYDSSGRLKALLRPTEPVALHAPPVLECGSACGCSAECTNRVVGRGLRRRLEVFLTPDRGWGLRTLDPVPRVPA